MVVSEGLQEIVVKLPKKLLNEVDGLMQNNNDSLDHFFYQATKSYVQERKDIRETMQKGYMEMARINLNIASEAFQAEEEAEVTLERLVSGV
ncbi:antitoxin [Terribacillus sp. DMT04]|uniref:antitoxin n=1 Tax=Terribacillus sp. DMT04 TaxID=2850441 RepID=UPI001C2BB580|nr:antitoxin [Terribacillus sp. DMT04]QXE02232.1 antitoxin [Terribacillus sp. DMT04]